MTAGSAPSPQLSIDPETNRIDSTGYAGVYPEPCLPAGRRRRRDAENRITEARTQACALIAFYPYHARVAHFFLD